MKHNIPLFKIYSDGEDIENVSDVIKSGMNWAIGDSVALFEELLAKYVGTEYALVFNSGTSALHALMIAYNFKKDDEIIVPSFSFIATTNAPLFVGAKPIFADIEEETFGLNPDDAIQKISSKTKAIMPMHYGGSGCKIRELRKIANDNDLILIEDAAESLGASIEKQKIGSFGDSAIFSFCAPKIISTGEGGAITTNSKDLYEKLKLIKSHGRTDDMNYFNNSKSLDYVSLGYNFRMSNVLASLGVAQLNHIDSNIQSRRRNSLYLIEQLKNIKGIKIPHSLREYFNTFQMFTIEVEKERNALMRFLNEKGISTKIYFSPIHHTHFYRNVLKYDVSLPITEKVSSKVLTLPMYRGLAFSEMKHIGDTIKEFFKMV